MAFGRAYQRLNVLTGSLREGARYASTRSSTPCANPNLANVKARIRTYGTAFGVTLDTSLVTVTCPGSPITEVRVGVTNYALFSDLALFGLETRTVSRTAIFRYELAP